MNIRFLFKALKITLGGVSYEMTCNILENSPTKQFFFNKENLENKPYFLFLFNKSNELLSTSVQFWLCVEKVLYGDVFLI